MPSNVPEMPVTHIDPVYLKSTNYSNIFIPVSNRRIALIARYQDSQNEKTARQPARARKIDELSKLKESTKRDLQLNELKELQNRFLAEIEVELEKTREPLPDTRIVFKRDYLPLEQLIAELGEVSEELFVPNY